MENIDIHRFYDSPIKLYIENIAPKITEHEDGYIYSEITKLGINVDKEELLKALNYDRNQYDRGYTAGYDAGYKAAQDEFMDKLKRFIEEDKTNVD